MTKNWPVRYYGFVVKPEELNLDAIGALCSPKLSPEDTCEWLDEETVWVNKDCTASIMSKSLLGQDIEGGFYKILCDPKYLNDDELDISVVEDNWFLLDLPKYPNLFCAMYKDKEALIAEAKQVYGAFVCEDFDWEGRLVHADIIIYG